MTTIEQQTLEAARTFFRKSANKEPDWEKRRYELTKDVATALLSNPAIFGISHQSGTLSWVGEKPLAELAVEVADSVIERLKQSSNN